jgi:hypothetical protein
MYYCIVRYSIMARIKLCKNPPGEANKSANRWGNLRAKGGVPVVPPSVYSNSILSLARVRIKYIPPTRHRCLFIFETV